MRLHIPAGTLKSEIQDEICLDFVVVPSTYRGVGAPREIQDEIAFCRGCQVCTVP